MSHESKKMFCFRFKTLKLATSRWPKFVFRKTDAASFLHFWTLNYTFWIMRQTIFSLCARIQKKNRVLIWPPPEMAKSRTCHPKNGRVQNLPSLNSPELGTLQFLGVASHGLSHFRGWPVRDSGFFSGFWHTGKIGGGKKDQPPWISYYFLYRASEQKLRKGRPLQNWNYQISKLLCIYTVVFL